MPLVFNGVTPTAIKFGTTDLAKVVYNGVTVWEKVTSRTYRYKCKACRYGTTSLSLPSSAGNFSISNAAGMWCFITAALGN